MEFLLLDVRYGLRLLARSPGFAVVAMFILALGIGANTAIFSVVDAVLLRPLPVADPQRIVVVHNQLPRLNLPHTSVSALQYLDYTSQADVFESTAALTAQSFNLTGIDTPERLQADRVTASFFPMLGINPAAGRWFTQEEDKLGANHVALLSFHVWKRLFHSEVAALDRTIQLNGEGYQVIGVASLEIEQLYPSADLWIPMAFTPRELSEDRRASLAYGMLARLRAGVGLKEAQAAMTTIAQRTPGTPGDFSIEVRTLLEEKVGQVRKPLYVLLGAVAVVLLIGCANIASLLLARASGRAREIAIRAAVGARRGRLIRQLLIESLLLAAAGGALGVLLGRWGIVALLRIAPANLPRLGEVRLDSGVFWFTLVLSLACGIIFGLVPAFAGSKTDLAESLNESGRGSSAGLARHRLRAVLVISEVALAFALLISAGLLVRSFAGLLDVRPGFNPHNVLTMRLSLPWNAYPGSVPVAAFYDSVLQRIAALPGVEHAAAAIQPPFTAGGDNSIFAIRNYQPGPGEPPPHADYLYVTADYFDAMRIPLLKGRYFTPSDIRTNGNTGPGATAIIDEALARRFWPDSDPIGGEIGWGGDSWATIIGVVGTALRGDLAEESKGTFYFPGCISNSTLVVRTASDPHFLIQAVRDQIHSVDPGQPVYDIKTMDERVSQSLDERRFAVVLLGLFAIVALSLAGIGLYGVIAYLVVQRTHEIGIRMALGASGGDVLKIVILRALLLAVAGLGIGLVIALGASRYLASLLFQIPAADAATFIAVSMTLLIVALAAAFIPAWRAARVDPIVALRYQ